MRRFVALILCIFLFAVPAHAANAAASVSTTAVVNENSACTVTIEADIRLDDPAKGLRFPLGKDIDSVTLNGSPVPGILQARTLEWVAISFSTLKSYT